MKKTRFINLMDNDTQPNSLNDEAFKKCIRESKFFRLLIRSLPGIFYALDDNFQFLIWNENVEKISGYTVEEILRKKLVDFFNGDDRIIIENAIKEVFNPVNVVAEATFITKKGKQIPYFFTGASAVIEGKSYTAGPRDGHQPLQGSPRVPDGERGPLPDLCRAHN